MERKLKVAITGANGRIGTVLRNAFASKYDLILFVYDPPEGATAYRGSDPDEKGPWFKIFKNVDLSNKEQLKGKFEGVDVVIHLAALVDVSPYGLDWESMYKNNFEATWNVFKECVDAKVKRIVFASSNHVQNGATIDDPSRSESINFSKLKGRKMELHDEPFPDSMYAVAKLFGEDIGKLCALQSHLECVSLRIGWVLNGLVDDPSPVKGTSSEDYMKVMYLSHRDCVGFFQAAITVPIKTENGIPYIVAYACSNNSNCIWNLTETINVLGYKPQDNSNTFFN